MSFQLPPNFIARALATQHDNATVTPTIISALSVPLGVGNFIFKYYLIYQSSAATTGIKFDLNFTGTVTRFVWNQYWVDVSAAAATAAATQSQVASTGGVLGAFASRAKGTAGRGVTLSIDTLNADSLMIIEGIAVVTVAGSLDLYHGSETANTTSIMAGSSVLVNQATVT